MRALGNTRLATAALHVVQINRLSIRTRPECSIDKSRIPASIKAQLAAHYIDVVDAPAVAAHRAPFVVEKHLHTAHERRAPIHQSHPNIRGTAHYSDVVSVTTLAVAEASNFITEAVVDVRLITIAPQISEMDGLICSSCPKISKAVMGVV
eukprot:CAMPEP_0118942274 /NCGR_PEP_ID=MMETSP1169-20130426/35865_1 /TAXON_ID=36882 /ORGANISM="Pyramimonas obovata, Strain CCMP722" /LENGTH=150 /DNA_ID=CAMNT_0006887269 /DNA_START=132 /DNA_END=581 /DNA_ORIENTATION=-